MKDLQFRCLYNSFEILNNNDVLNVIKYLETNSFQIKKYGYSSTRPECVFETDRINDVVDYYSRERVLVLKGDNFVVEISGNLKNRKPFVQKFEIKFKKKVEPEILKKFAIDFYQMLKSCYGFVNLNNTVNHYTPGRSICACLFGFSWFNIFGKPYLDMWGWDKIKKCPAIVESNKDYFTVMLSDNPLMNTDEIDIINNKLKLYFGDQYFFNEQFEFEKTTYDSIEEIVEYQEHKLRTNTYKAPSFIKYYD